jgi:hypothetical protein
MQDALTKKRQCNTCCSDEFKSAVGISDPDEINVEKGVVVYQSLINYYSKGKL